MQLQDLVLCLNWQIPWLLLTSLQHQPCREISGFIVHPGCCTISAMPSPFLASHHLFCCIQKLCALQTCCGPLSRLQREVKLRQNITQPSQGYHGRCCSGHNAAASLILPSSRPLPHDQDLTTIYTLFKELSPVFRCNHHTWWLYTVACIQQAEVICTLQLPPQSGPGLLLSPWPVKQHMIHIQLAMSETCNSQHYTYHYTRNHELCLLCIPRRKICQHTYFKMN